MKIEWLDILKLTVPFLTAVLMVWIKSWIESNLSRRHKQHALSRLLSDELQNSQSTVQALSRIAESAAQGKLRLVSIDVSTLISKLSCDLADLDSTHAYSYADLASSMEIVNKGLTRLASLTLTRASASTKEIGDHLNRAIYAQAKITCADFLSLYKVFLEVLKRIPTKYRYGDDQSLRNLEEGVAKAKNASDDWPRTPGSWQDHSTSSKRSRARHH